MSRITTVLFDFDGTIMDTNDLILKSWKNTFRVLRGEEVSEDVILPTLGEPLELTMEKFFPEVPLQKCLDTYRSWHHDNFVQLIKMFPGMMQLLEELKARGYRMGLVTSRLKYTTMLGVEKYDLGRFFDYILTADDTDKHKPDPAPILITMEKMGADPAEAIMVGDTLLDLGCARNAGVPSVLVDWTIAVPEEKKNEADYVIKKAEELLEILK